MSFQAGIPKFCYRFQGAWSFGHASALRENWLAKTLKPSTSNWNAEFAILLVFKGMNWPTNKVAPDLVVTSCYFQQ